MGEPFSQSVPTWIDIDLTSSEFLLRDLLNWMALSYLEFTKLVFDLEKQIIYGHILVLINGRFGELVGGIEAKLHDGDIVTFIPFYEGG